MDVERRFNDYHVGLTTEDINILCGYSNPNRVQLPLRVNVRGDAANIDGGEIFSFNCNRSREFRDNPYVIDEVLFEWSDRGPKVTTSAHALVSLLGEREFWVTRYDGENKIWLRREDQPLNLRR